MATEFRVQVMARFAPCIVLRIIVLRLLDLKLCASLSQARSIFVGATFVSHAVWVASRTWKATARQRKVIFDLKIAREGLGKTCCPMCHFSSRGQQRIRHWGIYQQ